MDFHCTSALRFLHLKRYMVLPLGESETKRWDISDGLPFIWYCLGFILLHQNITLDKNICQTERAWLHCSYGRFVRCQHLPLKPNVTPPKKSHVYVSHLCCGVTLLQGLTPFRHWGQPVFQVLRLKSQRLEEFLSLFSLFLLLVQLRVQRSNHLALCRAQLLPKHCNLMILSQELLRVLLPQGFKTHNPLKEMARKIENDEEGII